VSRAYNARRKAKRRQEQAAPPPRRRPLWSQPRRFLTVVPILVVAAILTGVAMLGFGGDGGVDRKKVREEVTSLLAGVPQEGAALGSSQAPVTIRIYADLECPTVKQFFVVYLPSIINRWVRSGRVKLEYRSLQTDTANEEMFFDQETAALAAGRQGRMWDFILTFVREQGEEDTEYATPAFLADIAAQLPGLQLDRWRRERDDPALSGRVALAVQSAHGRGMQFTPSMLLSYDAQRESDHLGAIKTLGIRREVEKALASDIEILGKEATGDVPTLLNVGGTR
jgi:hypothetical protein